MQEWREWKKDCLFSEVEWWCAFSHGTPAEKVGVKTIYWQAPRYCTAHNTFNNVHYNNLRPSQSIFALGWTPTNVWGSVVPVAKLLECGRACDCAKCYPLHQSLVHRQVWPSTFGWILWGWKWQPALEHD